MSTSGTNRRSFLKTGALVAAPAAAVLIPAAALADDGARAKLAQLEDERAIEDLHRAFLRRFNGSPDADCGTFLARADAIRLDRNVCAIQDDPIRDSTVEIAQDGTTASLTRTCRVEIERQFEGSSTLERMARFQGHGQHRHSEIRTLVSAYAKSNNGWVITSLHLA